jgi:S-adenosylmethionine-diacylgycerolhomoserine-N-methlytransferase
MIPDWRASLKTAARNLHAGGFIHVVDFGDLSALWPVASRALRHWLKGFHVAPRDELLALLEQGARGSADFRLHVLPGRYAFVLKASPSAIAQLIGE